MKLALQAVNDLEREGLISRYAMGGAMAAIRYLEPVSTFDVDIFVIFHEEPLILTLTPIYDYLRARGFAARGDAVVVGNWPVQFLPAATPLLREAVEQATPYDYEGVETRIMTPEHLMAIALQTGRPKDHFRLLQFLEFRPFDPPRLEEILARHNLRDAWRRFKLRCPDPS